MPMPRSHPLTTRARPPGPPGAQAGLGSGSLKSVVRACFLLPQSRAPLLFSSAPAVLPLSSTTRHDKTQPKPGSHGALIINDHLAALPTFHLSHVVINRRWSSPSHRLREKTHEKARAWIAIPHRLSLKPTNDRRWSDSTLVTRTGARSNQSASHDIFKHHQQL